MITDSAVKTDSILAVSRQSNEYKPGFISKKLMSGLLKYGIWFVFCLIMLFTGFGRFIADLAYERGMDMMVLTWGGFALLVYMLFSIITFFVDWKLENTTAYAHGVHNMPPISVLGRWLRKTFIDALGFLFISIFVITCYYTPLIYSPGYKLNAGGSANWWILAGVISLVLIPVYFSIRRALSTIMDNTVKRVQIASKANSTNVAFVLGIINIILIIAMWSVFSYLRLFQNYSMITLCVFITLAWIVLLAMMFARKLKSRETQISLAFMILVSVLTSWIFMQSMDLIAETKLGLPVRYGFFILVSVLLTIMIIEILSAIQLKTVQNEKVALVYQMCKRFSVIPFGILTYGLSGDNAVETRLFGFFGLYYIFIPENLEDKPELYASIATAFARAKGGNGTVLSIVRALLFTIASLIMWFMFDMTYLAPGMSWFSGVTGDPLLIFAMLIALGISFGVLGKPVMNAINRIIDRSSAKLIGNIVDKNVLDSYKQMEAKSLGTDGSQDAMANLYLGENPQVL